MLLVEESTGEGGWPILKSEHGDATNFPPAAACILGASVRRKRHQAWCWCSGRKSSDWADSFVACTCVYIAEDAEYSEAHFHWPG